MTNRKAIVELLREANKPMSAEQIQQILVLRGKETALTTVRCDLSRGKKDGIFTNNSKGWTLVQKKK